MNMSKKQFFLRLIVCLSAIAGASKLLTIELDDLEDDPAPEVLVTVSRAQVNAARSNFGQIYDFFNFNVAAEPEEVVPLITIRPAVVAVRNFLSNLELQHMGQIVVPAAPGLVQVDLNLEFLNQALGAASNILQTIDDLIANDLSEEEVFDHPDLTPIVWDDNSLLHRIDRLFDEVLRFM